MRPTAIARAHRAALPAAAGWLLVLCSLAVAAQDQPAARVEAELEVREVLLDVLVTGPQGHVIVGLDKDDFVVEEDGSPVELQSVSFYSNRRLLAPGRAAGGTAPRKHWPTRTVLASGPSLGSLFADDTLRDRTADLRVAMRELARPLGEIPGRKILILLGAELPSALSAGDRRRHDALIEALNGSNVAVYALDVTGRGRRPGLDELARATGGGYPFHGQDVTGPLREIERENSGFYLLSYRSARAPGESGYRRVEVRTTNPELVARARSGYGNR